MKKVNLTERQLNRIVERIVAQQLNEQDMGKYKFRFYIGGRCKFEKTITAKSLSLAWKAAHKIADEYPTKKFIEIANIPLNESVAGLELEPRGGPNQLNRLGPKHYMIGDKVSKVDLRGLGKDALWSHWTQNFYHSDLGDYDRGAKPFEDLWNSDDKQYAKNVYDAVMDYFEFEPEQFNYFWESLFDYKSPLIRKDGQWIFMDIDEYFAEKESGPKWGTPQWMGRPKYGYRKN